MTDSPSVMRLQPAEWNALLASKLATLTRFFQNNPAPTPELDEEVKVEIERVWAWLPAWLASASPIAVKPAPKPEANGAAQTAVKKPYAGKKRGRKSNAERAIQQ